MYGKPCYKSSTFKNEKSDSNVNITKILHLPFYMLFYSLESMMARCKIYWNRIVAWKSMWFITARLLQKNNYCVMYFCILWFKNVMHQKKIIINMMNLWFLSKSYSNISQYLTYLLSWWWTITNNSAITKTRCWPRTIEVTVITVLS